MIWIFLEKKQKVLISGNQLHFVFLLHCRFKNYNGISQSLPKTTTHQFVIVYPIQLKNHALANKVG